MCSEKKGCRRAGTPTRWIVVDGRKIPVYGALKARDRVRLVELIVRAIEMGGRKE